MKYFSHYLVYMLILVFPIFASAKPPANVNVKPVCKGDFVDLGGNQWENTGYYGCQVTIHFYVSPAGGNGDSPIAFESPMEALGDPRVPADVKSSITNEFLPKFLEFQKELKKINSSKVTHLQREDAFKKLLKSYTDGNKAFKVSKLKIELKAKK